jgi:hypothetical protein
MPSAFYYYISRFDMFQQVPCLTKRLIKMAQKALGKGFFHAFE